MDKGAESYRRFLNGDESGLKRGILHIFHGALAFVVDVCIAAPGGIFIPGAGVHPTFEGVAALAADDHAGKAVSVLVFCAANFVPHYVCILFRF